MKEWIKRMVGLFTGGKNTVTQIKKLSESEDVSVQFHKDVKEATEKVDALNQYLKEDVARTLFLITGGKK